MAKNKETVFVCSNCGNEFGKWMGQCPGCGEWNSLKEVKSRNGVTTSGARTREGKVEVKNLAKLEKNDAQKSIRFLSNIGELDRVLGNGFVRGEVVLFSGEPGIGKSTLLTQLLGKIGGLYVAGEESAEQIHHRVERLGLPLEKFDILETNSVEIISETIERTKDVYKMVIVDSIQVMQAEGGGTNWRQSLGQAGSPGQIREVTFQLVSLAKRTGVVIVIVGHVTKEGEIAGPKLLEHMVDTVLYFEGEKSSEFRILRATKNRFGSTEEVGVFVMEEKGLREVKSEEVNLVESKNQRVGSVATIVMEGTRPMAVEVQALVTESFAPVPKRVFSGIDYNRGQLLIAVAQKSLGIPLYKYDVFVAVTGGIRVEDTGADLAVVGAIYSSFKNLPLTPSLKKEGGPGTSESIVLVGEVSLLGEVRRVRGKERRQKEAEVLGRKWIEIENVAQLKGKGTGDRVE
jgi:DNA repair protein RadA/Sms